MRETNISAKKFIIQYGIIIGILWVIYGIIKYLINYQTIQNNSFFLIIEISIHIGIITYALHSYKSENNGFIKLNKALKIGIGIALIGGAMACLWNLLLYKIIEPEMLNQILDLKKTEMIAANPDMTTEQVQKSMEVAKKYSSPYLMSSFILLLNLFLGFLISLLGGAVMQKQRNPF